MIAGPEVQAHYGISTDRAAALVIGDGVACEEGPETSPSRGEAEIKIFEAEKVVVVEQPDRVEDVPPYQHQAAAHAVDDAAGEPAIRGKPLSDAGVPHAARRRRVRHSERGDPSGVGPRDDDGSDDADAGFVERVF